VKDGPSTRANGTGNCKHGRKGVSRSAAGQEVVFVSPGPISLTHTPLGVCATPGNLLQVWLAINRLACSSLVRSFARQMSQFPARFALYSRLTCTPRCCTSLYEGRSEANRGERSIQSMQGLHIRRRMFHQGESQRIAARPYLIQRE
jgi:hypothetical protein